MQIDGNILILTKQEALDVLDDNAAVVVNSLADSSRWSLHYYLVFRMEGKLWATYYQVGATEQQDETPWEYQDKVKCFEVEAYEKVVTEYRRV